LIEPEDPIFDLLDFADVQIFATVDGAMLEDLPGLLTTHNLSARALYYDHHSYIANINGPHLLHCPDDAEVMAVRNAFPPDAVVWWVWAEPDEVRAKAQIFRHLRGLGMVEIPENYPNPGRNRGPMERVLFRHADARVMARVLPVLHPAQRARLFGKAGAIVLEAHGRFRRALVPTGLPPAPLGFLRLTAAQMDQLGEELLSEQRVVISHFLRHNAPDETADLSDSDLDVLAAQSSYRAKELGLEQDDSILMFAFLVAVTGGSALTSREVEAALTDSQSTPDRALDDLLNAIKDAEQAGR